MNFQSFPLVLASSSQVRQKILLSAGLQFCVRKPFVDEKSFKQQNPQLTPLNLALALAKLKALSVSAQPDEIIIGADQVLEIDEKALDKVDNMQQARARLLSLRGRKHYLASACVLVKNQKIVWQNKQRSCLIMNNFSENLLDQIMKKSGDRILKSVGCYELEAETICLFKQIDNDYTAMLGLSILPLLAGLREIGGLKK